MNTTRGVIPVIQQTGDWVFPLEDLELAFRKHQLNWMTREFNRGRFIEDIATEINRDPDEVFLAMFDQSRKGKTRRPFGKRVRN